MRRRAWQTIRAAFLEFRQSSGIQEPSYRVPNGAILRRTIQLDAAYGLFHSRNEDRQPRSIYRIPSKRVLDALDKGLSLVWSLAPLSSDHRMMLIVGGWDEPQKNFLRQMSLPVVTQLSVCD